jgi:putative methanogenesis marker 16 metalloprotein
MKTIDEINSRIREGTAVVLTADELKVRVRAGETVTPEEVDVVTTGTFGVMSGTMAVLSFSVAKPGTFRKAERVLLNGVPAYPGPCPNERNGIVDLVVYGTAHRDHRYGGGHLFREIVEGRSIAVEVLAGEQTLETTITLDQMGLARIVATRMAFKNYHAMINRSPDPVQTIFSVTGLAGACTEVSVSGCGEINPLENDPERRFIGTGTRVLLNGGTGYVIGEGTRSSQEKPNLSVYGNMKGMDPLMMGGFITSAGPECLTSLAVPIPVLDQAALDQLLVLDAQVNLPIAGINDRTGCVASWYSEIWQGTDHQVQNDPSGCIHCETCSAAALCPTWAISPGAVIDRDRCVNCGTCIQVCPGSAFSGSLGAVTYEGRSVPITLRQSDRVRGARLCTELKERIRAGTFSLTGKVDSL